MKHGAGSQWTLAAVLVAGFAILGCSLEVDPAGESASASPAPVHVRKSVSTLATDGPELASIRKGIEVMKSRPVSDPTSWCYQANMHGYDPPSEYCNLEEGEGASEDRYFECSGGTPIEVKQGALPGWDQCQHGSYYFVPWHRMYVYYFERILREASGDPDLTLPYWPWDQTGHRDLPLPFREPADSQNPLWVSERSSYMNDGWFLPAKAVSTSDAMAAFCLATQEGDESFGGHVGRRQHDPLTGSLGATKGLLAVPHANVHTIVGGPVDGGGCDSSDTSSQQCPGLMADQETAAQDPIFWFHHSNIDRLWARWRDTPGHVDPTWDPNWMEQTFLFFDEKGEPVCMSAKEVLDTASQLDYVYDDEAAPGASTDSSGPDDKERLICTEVDTVDWLASSADGDEDSGDDRIELGGDTVTVTMALSEDAKSSLGNVLDRESDEAAASDVVVQIEGIQYRLSPGVAYGVFVEPQADRPLAQQDDRYAGPLEFFHGRSVDPYNNRVHAGDILRRLRASGRWDGESLTIAIAPLELEGPEGVDAEAPLPETGRAWFRSVAVGAR